jgi:hypothetical protein
MRRVLSETANHPRGIYDHGTFTFDTYLVPDPGNVGMNSDTASFRSDAPGEAKWVSIGRGKRLQVQTNTVTVEKDIRHFIRFLGMMTHRLAALPEQKIGGHTVGGIVSKRWEKGGSVLETGNGRGDENRFWALLYDHYPPDLESQDRAKVPVVLQIRNLPASVKQARVTVYRLDKEHGSLYAFTYGGEHRPRKQGQGFGERTTYSAEDIEAARRESRLATDEDFPRNGELFPVSAGAMDLDLGLAANRVLFVEIDWGKKTRRAPEERLTSARR